jgi:hypothetical protein
MSHYGECCNKTGTSAGRSKKDLNENCSNIFEESTWISIPRLPSCPKPQRKLQAMSRFQVEAADSELPPATALSDKQRGD